MDFIRVAYKDNKDGTREFYPSLQALESQDLVIRGGQFVAIWDEETGLYSRRQSHVPDIIDRAFAKMVGERLRPGDTVKKMRVFDNQMYSKFLALVRSIGDMGPDLDQTIVFADQTPAKADAATFKMPYSLSTKPHPAWDTILNTLYDPEQRIKIEYAIDRFAMEVKRQLDVLDRRLAQSEYLAGGAYTIADIATWPWYGGLAQGRLYGAAEFLQVQEYRQVQRWADAIARRPAVQRGRKVNCFWGDPADQLPERHDASDFDAKTRQT